MTTDVFLSSLMPVLSAQTYPSPAHLTLKSFRGSPPSTGLRFQPPPRSLTHFLLPCAWNSSSIRPPVLPSTPNATSYSSCYCLCCSQYPPPKKATIVPPITNILLFYLFIYFLSAPQHKEFPGQGSDSNHSCGQGHSCSNIGSLTHCARPGIKPVCQHSQDTSDSIVP